MVGIDPPSRLDAGLVEHVVEGWPVYGRLWRVRLGDCLRDKIKIIQPVLWCFVFLLDRADLPAIGAHGPVEVAAVFIVDKQVEGITPAVGTLADGFGLAHACGCVRS